MRSLRSAIRTLAASFCCLLLVGNLTAAASEATLEGWTARFDQPTDRYGHAIMGDLPEWGRLCLTDRAGSGVCVTLPERRVFEDMAPRLADLNGDGTPEVVVVESDRNEGAALVVYRLDSPELTRIATPPIGRAFRWLAPAAIGDLNGDGNVEIAYVDRPHLAKTLRVWSFRGDKLVFLASQKGLTNHRIGEPFISGGLRHCGNGPEIITVDGRWSKVMATTLTGQTLKSRPLGPFAGQSSLTAALACRS